jgi:hypothetical protein
VSNLISRERAKYNLPSATTSDDRTIDALIAACSDAIRKYCRRHFALGRYDEVLDGASGEQMLLREYPIQSVESVRCSPEAVLEVTNTATTTNQQARVTVTAAGLELVRVASGARAVDTSVTWSASPTLQAVASAIDALGHGWAARVASGYELFAAQELYVAPSFGDAVQSQGALDCRGRWAGLVLHVEELSSYRWDGRGWLYRPEACGDEPWAGGPGWWRVQYTAGYAEVPHAVQEACAQWVALLFRRTTHDPTLASESSAPSGGTATAYAYAAAQEVPAAVRGLLAPWVRRVV